LHTSPAARRVARALVLGVSALALLAATAPAAPDGAAFDTLATRLRALRRAGREARLRLDPRATLESERAYNEALAEASRAIAATPAAARPAGAGTVFVLLQLIAARDAGATRWLEGLSREEALRVDPSGAVLFWVGVVALDGGRWARARDLFAGPVEPSLREHADWLRVAAITELDATAAGAAAAAILAQQPRHRFAAPLALRAARYLSGAGRTDEARALIRPWLDAPDVGDNLRAGLRTRTAELARRAGDSSGFHAQFALAAQLAPGSPDEAMLRLNQAWRILEERPPVEAALAAPALRVTLKLSRARDGIAAFHRWSGRVEPEARREMLGLLFENLYRTRSDDDLLVLAEKVRAGGDRADRVSAELYAGRVWKRRRNLDRMSTAYRAAAAAADSARSLSAGERRDASAALWELGRELEDAERWPEAVAAFAELRARFPDETNAVEGGVQEALCAAHAGDAAGALARLERLCDLAPPGRLAAPCLWRALLGAPGEGTEFLSHAMAETNPGYYAFRARGEITARRTGTGSDFWATLADQVRDPAAWPWPGGDGRVSPLMRVWLERFENDPRADQGLLFLALAHGDWALELWRSFPGWRDLTVEERAALLRALGDPEDATRVAIEGGGPNSRYPVAFAAEIAEAADRFGLSPAFLLAVMRQESLLDPRATSGAGARGLFQLMPATARRMADTLGWTGFDLERPRDNALLGACHLAELLRECRGEVPVALAAYNAGLGRAHQWRDRARDPDDFIERIGFPETRRFVRSVLMHYSYYRSLYPVRPQD
jgi:hypothetical protein